MPKIRVLVIEDNRLLREGIVKMIGAEADMEVQSSAGDSDTLEIAAHFSPQIILLDLGLKHQNTLSLVDEFRRECPDCQIIIMDLVPSHADVVELVKAGVSGFILKDATLFEFLDTIRTVARGMKVLPALMTDSLFSQIIEHALQSGKVKKMPPSIRMTRREQEVIALIANGKSNKEIAAELNIAVHTVKSHVHNILDKLSLHTRLQLASYANLPHNMRKTDLDDSGT